MVDVELVIRIPEEVYKKISNSNPSYAYDFPIYYAIKNGTLLPKGHGDLIDRNSIQEIILEDDLSQLIWNGDDQVNCELYAPTIIPADKEGED